MQVRRNGNWITVPVESAQAQIGKGKAGQVNLVIGNDDTDPTRSQLYEGDRIRMFRGVLGAPPVRCWTGYVDTRGPTDSQGISRQIAVTDHIKELNDAILIDGVFYDNLTATAACADVIQRAITSQQLKIYDDNDNVQSTTASYSSPTGNNVCYFPDLLNDDGSMFYLPMGTLASYTSSTGQMASFSIPVASGASYSTFELPKRYVIASTMVMPGFTIASTAQSFPPASGTAVLDAYNGLLYFASSQASTMVSFSATYYDSPNWAFAPGTKCGDVISQIMDKVGCRWGVDANGKFYMTRVDAIHVPQRILNKGQYVSNAVEINRDRRNVIVALGWDGNCGGILCAKAVNTDDINNAPPKGLGKRAYLVVQDASWKTQYAVSKAAYYAVQQVGRRGKIVNVQILDDPTITTPETVLCFESGLPEIGSGDFFYVEDIQWNYATSGQGFQAMMSLSGTMLPGQGLVYLGPITGTTSYGSLDYTQDVECITNPYLTPAGGSYFSTFSIAAGWTLSYTVGSLGVTESVDIYGSDGSHIVGDQNVLRAANQTLNLVLPTVGLVAGVLYCVRLWVKDSNGNIAIFRTFATARA